MSRTPSLAAILALALAVTASGTALAQDDSAEPIRTILVSGSGQTSVEPDEAVIRLGVNAKAANAKAAMRKAARSMDAVIEALHDAGIAENDIRTVRLDLRQYRQRNADNQVVGTGWQVDNSVKAVVRDIETVSDAIDAAVVAGATDVNNIRFRASDSADALAQARVAAIEDAAIAAGTLAEASGLEVLGVLSIVEGSASYPTTLRFRGESAGDSAAYSTPIEPGLVEVSTSVTVEYELG